MIICDVFCECHDIVANSLTYTLLELKQLTGKKEKSLFYQISDKPTLNDSFEKDSISKRTLRFAFTSSQTKCVFSNKHSIYELPHDLPIDLRLRMLGS